MGYALAEQAMLRGARVTLISGPTQIDPLPGIQIVPVVTADDMQKAVQTHLDAADVLVMAAAVADYRVAAIAAHKLKKETGPAALDWQKTPDILALAGKNKGRHYHVGFAVETENEIENA